MSIPKVISQVVDNDLCIGCGLCTYACHSNALSMKWNSEGFIVATLADECDDDSSCIKVCPFNPNPEKDVKNETAIASIFLNDNTSTDAKLGKVISTYIGYSNEYRESSSSGGIATYIFDQLLKKGIVDHVFCVESSNNKDEHYKYHVVSSPDDLLSASKTKYYPVTLSSVFNEIDKLEGRIAIVGVACFIKAVRLAQYYNPILKEKIPFTVGIICGGVKSRFFTEYLASKSGATSVNIESPEFRIKDPNSVAIDYSFGCKDLVDNKYKKIKMREVGDMWGTGLFKANACDFCDDVSTELADISLGDAWIDPYKLDGLGNSIIITRSPLAENLIIEGIKDYSLNVERATFSQIISSQQGSFNHRHDGLYTRLKEADKEGIPIAEKRYGQVPIPFIKEVVQKLRRITRKRSLILWIKTRDSEDFDREMVPMLKVLRFVSRASNLRNGLKRRVNGFFN